MFNIYNRINVCNDNLKKYKLFSLAVEIYLYFFTFLYMQPRLICKATPYIFYVYYYKHLIIYDLLFNNQAYDVSAGHTIARLLNLILIFKHDV